MSLESVAPGAVGSETPQAVDRVALRAIDRVEVVSIMDNTVDSLMASTDVARRHRLGPNAFDHPRPIAEHGFCALIRVQDGDRHGTILFDTGMSPRGTLHNLDALNIVLNDVEAIVLSHGHADHAMGLPGVLERLGMPRPPLVLHPDAYLERKVVMPNGDEVAIPPVKKADLQEAGVEVLESAVPTLLLDGALLVSGEVTRATAFEQGFPTHFAKREGSWGPDPLIRDDQFVVAHVRGKGLVIVTGCAHAGIINIIRYAQALTGVDQVHAVIGGFHLTGGQFEKIIPDTVAALEEIGPRYLVPGHCTGWSATHQIARAMPDAFVPNSVGTTFVFET